MITLNCQKGDKPQLTRKGWFTWLKTEWVGQTVPKDAHFGIKFGVFQQVCLITLKLGWKFRVKIAIW